MARFNPELPQNTEFVTPGEREDLNKLPIQPGNDILSNSLHKMSQNITVLLTLLELSQITGKFEKEDISLLLGAAQNLRNQISILRSPG